MKQNHESFKDNTPFNDNEFIKATAFKKEGAVKQVKPVPKMPKRKWEKNKYQVFYLIHFLLLGLFLPAGFITHTIPLVVAIVPYGGMVFMMYRIGGSLSGKGLNYVLWNLSVLVSTYLNTQMPNLRRFKMHLLWGGGIFAILVSLMSAWFLLVGLVAFSLGLLFAFADKDDEHIANMSRMISIGFLVTGTLGLFVSPGLALAVLFLSLCFHHVFEKWDTYEFTLNEE
jgi:hypothetical protein